MKDEAVFATFPRASFNFLRNNSPLCNMIFLHSANDWNRKTKYYLKMEPDDGKVIKEIMNL